MRKLALSIGALILLASSLPAQSAADIPTGTEWHSGLAGYRSFAVAIFVTGEGVDTLRIRHKIELKLRQSGITVNQAGFPILSFVCATLTNSKIGLSAYTCATHVRDYLVRAAPTPLRINADVYQSFPAVGTTTSRQLDEAVRDYADRLIDEFLNDWYKANPGK